MLIRMVYRYSDDLKRATLGRSFAFLGYLS